MAACVARVAAHHPSAWTTAVGRTMQELRISDFEAQDSESRADQNRPMKNRAAKQYVTACVALAIANYEETWRVKQLAAASAKGGYVFADCLHRWWPLDAVQAWAQLRLQGTCTFPRERRTSRPALSEAMMPRHPCCTSSRIALLLQSR